MKEDNTVTAKNEEAEKKSRVSQALEYLEKIQKELFVDETGTAYFSFDNPRGLLVTLAVDSSQFVSFLQSSMLGQFKKTLKTDVIKETQQVLSVRASDSQGKARHLYRRVGKVGDAIYYDLGDGIIQIDAKGWRHVKLDRQIFRFHSQVSLKQIHPVQGGDLNSFFENINVKSEVDKLLIKIFIVTAFIPDLPHPILVIHGPKGSGKSGFLRMLLQLIDPSAVTDVSMKKDDEFFLFASNRWVIGLDNVSRIRWEDSDTLCKLSTGSAFQKRGLYTNDSIIVMQLKNVVILNGIPCVAEKPDLLDRSLLVEMSEISPTERKTEDDINGDFNFSLPGILGAVFTTLSDALKIYPGLKLKKLYRMADFHRYAVAIGIALGHTQAEVESALDSNYRKQIDMATESSWLAQLVIAYLTERAFYEGTASELLQEFKTFNEVEALGHGSQLYRLQPNRLTGELTRLKQTLECEGVSFERSPRANERILKISMSDEVRQKKRNLNSIVGTVGIDGKNAAGTQFDTFEPARSKFTDDADGTDDEFPFSLSSLGGEQ